MDTGDFLSPWISAFSSCSVSWDRFVTLGSGVWLCSSPDDCAETSLESLFLRISVNLGFLGGASEFDSGLVRASQDGIAGGGASDNSGTAVSLTGLLLAGVAGPLGVLLCCFDPFVGESPIAFFSDLTTGVCFSSLRFSILFKFRSPDDCADNTDALPWYVWDLSPFTSVEPTPLRLLFIDFSSIVEDINVPAVFAPFAASCAWRFTFCDSNWFFIMSKVFLIPSIMVDIDSSGFCDFNLFSSSLRNPLFGLDSSGFCCFTFSTKFLKTSLFDW